MANANYTVCEICGKKFIKSNNFCTDCEYLHGERYFNIGGKEIKCYDRDTFDDFEYTKEYKKYKGERRYLSVCACCRQTGMSYNIYVLFEESYNGKIL